MGVLHIVKDTGLAKLYKINDKSVFDTINQVKDFFYTYEGDAREIAYCRENESIYFISRKSLSCYCKGEIVKSVEDKQDGRASARTKSIARRKKSARREGGR